MTYDESTTSDDENISDDESTSEEEESIETKQARRDALLRRYQRGIGLLDHPNFLLLYVPDDGNKMRLVKPASDSYHRERIIQMLDEDDNCLLPHYALSHLWGTSKVNRHLWEEVGDYVDDENGDPAEPVSMRPEKRNALLTLLDNYPDSYWWIDVLCARSDTPLGIMGDIYACCYLCYAMVDCEPELITRIRSVMRRMPRGSFQTRHSRWTKDFLKEAHQLVIDTFYQCSWWKRVWTWQEAVLPVEVLFIPETFTELSDNVILSIHELDDLTSDGWFAYEEMMNDYEWTMDERLSDEEGELINVTIHSISFQTSTSLVPYVDDSEGIDDIAEMGFGGSTTAEINWSRNHCHHHTPYRSTLGGYSSLFDAFAESPRQCMDPVDYVYGVLGIFQIDIPRKTDPNEYQKRL
ncbi:predicted protein [Lichtheimia corymbifera JMRC:FSU:9682]|uniref:Heterokaryon incompatibility domain-containing protein n=1 Tax=Lichtheimia corymbifera JMRC:FSU:9682 TaxID=1263082 RepID=A0A068SDL5_9FUNG|nr:predicted protein [Lichtheimia corymbifera JMRC:FSU:9682]